MGTDDSSTFPRELLLPPVARAAYSDRTAWLMATMSKLAYMKFESEAQLTDDLASKLASMTNPKAIRETVSNFIEESQKTQGSEISGFKSSLRALGFELVETFNNGGTQAFLAKRSKDRVAVLAFRGTEKDMRDIKADLNARFYKHDGVKIHNGFYRAFDLVQAPVKSGLAKLKDYKLYITGHSLGGALAIVATRAFSSDRVAACYTFGSPRVGTSEFGDRVKVPIYRVVNAADLVPRVPPTFLIDAVIVVSKVFKIIPIAGTYIVQFLENFKGYSHHGDMRYLTACDKNFSGLRLLSNPAAYRRFGWWIKRVSRNFKAGFEDHSIVNYCDKLEEYALSRVDVKPLSRKKH